MNGVAEPALAAGHGTSAWAQRALGVLMEQPGVMRAGLAVLEGGGRRLRFTASERSSEEARWCHVDAYDDVPLNRAIRSGRPVAGSLAELAASYPSFVQRQDGTGVAALAAVPFVASGHTLGGFVVFFDGLEALSRGPISELQDLGAELGEELRRAQLSQARPPGGWASDVAPGALVAHYEVPDDSAAVAPARRALRESLREWGINDDTTDTAVLCLSELVTNAVIHGSHGCSVRVLYESGVLTIAVRNGSPLHRLEAPESGDPLQVHGRGLQLVGALASRWGSDLDNAGVTVWFVLDV